MAEMYRKSRRNTSLPESGASHHPLLEDIGKIEFIRPLPEPFRPHTRIYRDKNYQITAIRTYDLLTVEEIKERYGHEQTD